MTRLSILALAVGLLSGCASFQNTPAQDRTWARYRVCHETDPRFQIQRVYSDGRFLFTRADGPDSSTGSFVACMTGGNPNWQPSTSR